MSMSWHVRNNQSGGIEMVMSATALPGYVALSPQQHKILLVSPLGTTVDTAGNPVAPPAPAVEHAAFLVRQREYRKAKGSKLP